MKSGLSETESRIQTRNTEESEEEKENKDNNNRKQSQIQSGFSGSELLLIINQLQNTDKNLCCFPKRD